MQRFLVGLVLVVAAGCLRQNPDFTEPVSPGPGPGPIAGPPAGNDGSVSFDLSTPHESPHDMAMSIAPDLSSSTTPGSGVTCGPQTCIAPQFCCYGLGAPTCADPGLLSCVGGKQVACDGPEDCGGDTTCCGSVVGSSCVAHCPTQAQLCHQDSDCGDGDQHCCPDLFGAKTCRNHGC